MATMNPKGVQKNTIFQSHIENVVVMVAMRVKKPVFRLFIKGLGWTPCFCAHDGHDGQLGGCQMNGRLPSSWREDRIFFQWLFLSAIPIRCCL